MYLYPTKVTYWVGKLKLVIFDTNFVAKMVNYIASSKKMLAECVYFTSNVILT